MRILPLALVLSTLMLAACETSPEPVPFERHFQKVRTINLSDEVFIDGRIRSLDVNPRGDLLVTDIGHVYLFEPNGAFQQELNPSPCHPGFQMQPISAHFRPDGKILMFNSGGGAFAFLFYEDGTCWKPAHDDIYHPAAFTFASDGRMYAHYIRPNADTNQIKRLTGEGKLLESFDVPASEYNNVDMRLTNQGAMIYLNGDLYHALPSRAAIQVLDTTGKRKQVINNPPSYYRPVTEHIPGHFDNAGQFLEATNPIFERSTIVHSLYRLAENKLLIQYKDNDRYGIDVVNLDGHRLITGPIIVDLGAQIRWTGNRKIYRVVQPNSLVQEQIPNPRIEVYTFEE